MFDTSLLGLVPPRLTCDDPGGFARALSFTWDRLLALDAPIVSVTVIAVHLIAILAVMLEERRRPSTTLAWLLTIVFLPAVGIGLYVLLGSTRLERVRRKSNRASRRIAAVLETHGVHQKLSTAGVDLEHRTEAMLALGGRLATTPASRGNAVALLVNGAATYRSMIHAIEAATDHIHVEFYIIQPDETGTALRDRLVKRAQEGVSVRVVYDSIGSIALPRRFWRPLEEAGGRAAAFRPVARILYRLRHRDRIDFRNHRKIVVTDGRIGFTGGINVGKEYLGLDPEIGDWRDTHLRIEGPAVLSLQQAFAEDWLSATGDVIEDERYFPEPHRHAALADGGPAPCVVQVVDSGPDRRWSPIVYLFVQAMASARKRLWITNPYFIPSGVVETALISAALRGIDVRLLLPKRADHLLIEWASRSYYRELLEAGVRIYEYERGFVHAKTMVVDDWVGTVGSANMDMRSFQLNFELNAFVYGGGFAEELAKQFLSDLRAAPEVDGGAYARLSYPRRLRYSMARLLSPLL